MYWNLQSPPKATSASTEVPKAPSGVLKPPALLIVGDVAALGSQFNWRDHLPLKNRRFVLFRALHQQSRFRDMLHQAGGEVLTLPLNNIQPVQNPLKTVDINTLTHIIFTSENGVISFFDGPNILTVHLLSNVRFSQTIYFSFN